MFIFNFQNLGLITLNPIKKKTVDIIILLISLRPPQFTVNNCHQMTDALHDFAVEVTWEPSLNNLMDSISHDFSSVFFYTTSTNIWQTSNLKKLSPSKS